MSEEDIVRQLEANTRALEELKEATLKTARYVKWLRIMDILKLLLIIIPLIAAYIYMPMLIKNLTGYYQGLMPSGIELPKDINSFLK